MGAHSVAWDHGYEDYFEGNGANPYEDIHLHREWFDGWEAARRSHVEEAFWEEMEKVVTPPIGPPIASHDFWGPGGRSTTSTETQLGNKILGWMGLRENREEEK